jgi:regulator of replication initiation timing
MTNDPDAGVRYLFIVARKNPDILARVQDRLQGDPRIEVISDRRYGERRQTAAPHSMERRGGDRRRPTNVWNDLTIYPTLVAQQHVESYAELEQKLANTVRDTQALGVENDQLREMTADLERRLEALLTGDQQLRGENTRLREEIVELQRRLGALASEDAEFKAEVAALLGQAEQALGGLITRFQRFTQEGRQPQREPPRLRSL